MSRLEGFKTEIERRVRNGESFESISIDMAEPIKELVIKNLPSHIAEIEIGLIAIIANPKYVQKMIVPCLENLLLDNEIPKHRAWILSTILEAMNDEVAVKSAREVLEKGE